MGRMLAFRLMRLGLAALVNAILALGCGGKNAPSQPTPEPSVAEVRCSAPSTPSVLYQGTISGLVLQSGQALFTDRSLLSVPLAGGALTTLVVGDGISGLVATPVTAYFTAEHAVGAASPDGKQPSEVGLYAAPIAGGTGALIRDGFSLNYAAADSTSVYLADGTGKVLRFVTPDAAPVEMSIGDKLAVRDIAVNSTDLFVAAEDLSNPAAPAGAILKVAKGGGTARVILMTLGLPDALAVDDNALFWLEDPPPGTFGEGHLARAGLDGSQVTSTLDVTASALALDATSVYLLSDSLIRVPRAGGASEVLVSGVSGGGFLHLAGADAVWVDHYSKALSDPTPASIMTVCLHSASH